MPAAGLLMPPPRAVAAVPFQAPRFSQFANNKQPTLGSTSAATASRPQQAQHSAAHLGGGGDDVRLVHAAHGHAVELEGAGHQQQARGQLQRAGARRVDGRWSSGGGTDASMPAAARRQPAVDAAGTTHSRHTGGATAAASNQRATQPAISLQPPGKPAKADAAHLAQEHHALALEACWLKPHNHTTERQQLPGPAVAAVRTWPRNTTRLPLRLAGLNRTITPLKGSSSQDQQ